jgi:thiol:disulfide interchange protein DsbD
MKKITVVLSLSLLVCLSACGHKAKGNGKPAVKLSMVWAVSLTDALARAKVEGRPVMVDFGGAGYGWCKKMDDEVLCDPDVVELSKKFINAKVDVDKDPEDLKPYAIGSLPTLLFLDRDGGLVTPVVGYSEAKEFIKTMKSVLRKSGSI